MAEITPLRGVATPYPLLLDEIAASVVLERRSGVTLSEIRWEDQNCDDSQLVELISQGFFPIELGSMSYKSMDEQRVRSATEAVLVNLKVSADDFSFGEFKLVELMAKRNKSGHMNQTKQFPMGMPRIFGNLYDLDYNKIELIERFKDVVHAFLDDWDRRVESEFTPPPPDRDDASMMAEFPEFADLIEKCQSTSFTPGRYLRDLWRRGDPPDEIRKKVDFWIDAHNRWQKEYCRTKTDWETGRIEKFNFSIVDGSDNEISGAAVETENPFVAKVAAPTVDIFINRRPNGHGAIMTLKRDLSALSQELERLEPGRWYYHQPAGHLINGDRSPASEIALDQLVELAKNFPPSSRHSEL